MYIHHIKLNTRKCKICKREFKSEKALKDHIFNAKVIDKKHVKYKNYLRKLRMANAKVVCPICKRKMLKSIGAHFTASKDKDHQLFRKKQIEFFIKLFVNKKKSPRDIKKINSKFIKNFGTKYITKKLILNLGEYKYKEISDEIFSKKRKRYWNKFSKEERKKMMKKVYESEWSKLSEEERKNHPWVIAGRKASLESAKKGSKNQKHAFDLLKKILPTFNWKYNYAIDKDWHVDIADPEKKIFIEWDGRHHRIPIHGQGYLNNRKNRDKIKNRIITEDIKGLLIRVEDNGRENLNFVKTKIKQISDLIKEIDKRNVVIRI